METKAVAAASFAQWELILIAVGMIMLTFCLGYVLGHVAGGSKAFAKGIEAGAKLYRNN